jgi:hypothetical protein
MNWERFLFAFIAAFAFKVLWGWMFNGIFMRAVYARTANLWRTASEMMSRMQWLLFGLAISTFAIVLIFASGFVGGGVAAGMKLGIMLAIIASGSRLGMFYLQPLPGKLIGYWIVGDVIDMMVTGAIVGAIYKP